jgi:hypothetical protein
VEAIGKIQTPPEAHHTGGVSYADIERRTSQLWQGFRLDNF